MVKKCESSYSFLDGEYAGDNINYLMDYWTFEIFI